MSVTERFASLPWHDAGIREISVPRTDPGNTDTVTIRISWPDGRKEAISFLDCREARLHMNFGVLDPETVMTASSTPDSKDIVALRHKWRSAGDIGPLHAFYIELNSTGSELLIIARDFQVSEG